MLTAADISGTAAIIPTPATRGADRADATSTIDLDETARVVGQLIADRIDGLIVLGTTGECATITRDEFEAFVDCVLRTVHGRVPTFIGTTALGTHEVVHRSRFARDRGADGILLGLPMWQPLTIDMAVEYYRTVGELFPDLSIMVYGNPRAFQFAFARVSGSVFSSAVPRAITSAKYSRPKNVLESQAASKGRVHFLPNDGGAMKFVDLAPETTTACWSTAASMGPEPALAQIRAIQSGDMESARKIAARPQVGRASRSARLPKIPIFSPVTTSSSRRRASRWPAIAIPDHCARRTTSFRRNISSYFGRMPVAGANSATATPASR